MNPKMIGALVLSVGLFFAGWIVNGYRWDAKYTTRENMLREQYTASLQAHSDRLQGQIDGDRKTVEILHTEQAALNAIINRLKEKARREKFTTIPSGKDGCDHPFNTRFPISINRMLDASEGVVVPPDAASTPSAGGTAEGAAPTSEITGNSLVDWFGEISRSYGQCKEQLDNIRRWDSKQK
jgi:hypothetical protein